MRRGFPIVTGFVLGAAVSTASMALAQFPRQAPAGNGRVVFGDDIGFRIDGTDPRTGGPLGTWMLKIDGEWVEARGASGIKQAK